MGIVKDTPENHGLSSKALLDFFTQIEQLRLEVNSFMLLQDGRATAQFWRKPYTMNSPQLLFSLSKSFTSIAVGIARDYGYLDLQDKVIAFFPSKLPNSISSNLAKMTIHHLLSMNAGHHDNIYNVVAAEQDWVKTFLALDVEHEPGTYYRYSTHSTYILSAIIEQATGQSLVDFLMPKLFEPLGIPRPSWETCPMGIAAGGMGLSLSTESIAKFGQMLLNQGMYEGRRIVSESYIAVATAKQSDNRLMGAGRADSVQGYGYQFHLCRHGCYRGDGSFGQLCFVAPEQQIVIAATASFNNMGELQALLDLIYAHIIQQVGNTDPCSTADQAELEQRLSSMSCTIPVFKPVPDFMRQINNHCYMMDENPQRLAKVRFFLQEERLQLHLLYGDDREDRLAFDFTKAVHTKAVFAKDLSMQLQEVVTYASWQHDNTLQLTLMYIETPYRVIYTIVFKEKAIDLQFNINVSLTLSDYKARGSLFPH